MPVTNLRRSAAQLRNTVTPYAALHNRLTRGECVILDGGVGSELVRRGVRWRANGLRTDSATVANVHDDYLEAGADILRTNTFQLNRRSYRNVFRDAAHMRHIGAPDLEQRIPDLVPRAVKLAQEARARSGRSEVAIAGVMSPLEHCFRPDLAPADDAARQEHHEIAQLLAGAGVDLLLLESMNTVAEARIAMDAARQTGLPVWLSFVVGADGNILSGEPLEPLGADVVLANCAPPADIDLAVANLTRQQQAFGAYAHLGRFDPPSWKFEFFPQFTGSDTWPPERYATHARRWRDQGAQVIGGCCGSGPDHVRALKTELAGAWA
jgi:S-methylmethionine-dependent homocysteine/selenocysteine methylase